MDKKESLCLAMIIGDGHIRKDKPELSVSHSAKYKEYIDWKASELSKVLDKQVNVYPVISGKYESFRFSATDAIFNELRPYCYESCGNSIITREVLEKLDSKAIAIWYMDDGSLVAKKRNGKIHAYDLTISTYCDLQSVNNIVDYFNQKYGIKFTIKKNKGKFSVRCGTKQARKFIKIVEPHIVKCMEYKTQISECKFN